MTTKLNVSQTLLALAIALLAFSLIKIADQIPNIIQVINKASPQVDTVIDEVTLIREEVKSVRLLVAKQTPDILAKVEATLPIIEQALAESERYSSQLPIALEQIAKLTTDVQVLNKSLPNILHRIDAVVEMANNTTNEIALWRPHSTEYIAELALYRTNIPQYLTRVENIVVDAKSIGTEASSGIVKGFFKGVVSLPFEVVSGLSGIVDSNSQSAKYLTATDVSLMQEKVVSLLNDKNASKAIWQNTESGNRGNITKGKLIYQDNKSCYNLTFHNFFSQNKEILKQLMCLDKEGLWKII